MKEEKKITNISSRNQTKSKKTPTEVMPFEGSMQWLAFLSAKVICQNDTAKIEIMSLLTKGQKRIPLHQLLGASAERTNFCQLFINEFKKYFRDQSEEASSKKEGNQAMDSNTEEDTPPRPRSGKRDPEDIEAFIKRMTEDNLVELYFPNGLSFLGRYTMSSTAHPLTNSPSNTGIQRLHYTDLRKLTKVAKSVTINWAYLFKYSNIIIARPYRQADNINGLYEEYPDINFTKFLKRE